MIWQWRLELSRDNTTYPNGIDGRWQLAFSMAKMNVSTALNTLRTEKVKLCPFLYPMLPHYQLNFLEGSQASPVCPSGNSNT